MRKKVNKTRKALSLKFKWSSQTKVRVTQCIQVAENIQGVEGGRCTNKLI